MKQRNPKNSYRGVLDLDRLPAVIKFLNWIFCFVVAADMAVRNWFRVVAAFSSSSPASNSLVTLLILLSVLAPTCIAAAWLRLTGVRWTYALLLFILVAGTAFGIRYLFAYIVGAMVIAD